MQEGHIALAEKVTRTDSAHVNAQLVTAALSGNTAEQSRLDWAGGSGVPALARAAVRVGAAYARR